MSNYLKIKDSLDQKDILFIPVFPTPCPHVWEAVEWAFGTPCDITNCKTNFFENGANKRRSERDISEYL